VRNPSVNDIIPNNSYKPSEILVTPSVAAVTENRNMKKDNRILIFKTNLLIFPSPFYMHICFPQRSYQTSVVFPPCRLFQTTYNYKPRVDHNLRPYLPKMWRLAKAWINIFTKLPLKTAFVPSTGIKAIIRVTYTPYILTTNSGFYDYTPINRG
jgi:hypothetical protein